MNFLQSSNCFCQFRTKCEEKACANQIQARKLQDNEDQLRLRKELKGGLKFRQNKRSYRIHHR